MPLNSPILTDGDAGFLGFASRLNPLTLQAGVLQLSENMRIDRGIAKTRKGLKRLADNINPGEVPLTVPFVLNAAPNEPVVKSSYSGGIFSAAVMRSPDEINSMEIVVLAGSDKAFTYITEGGSKVSAAWSGGDIMVDATHALLTDTGEVIIASILPTELTYPTSPDETIETTDNVSMLQAYDRMYIFREADTTVEGWETKYTNVSGITLPSSTTARVNVTAHGYPVGARVRIEGSTASAFDGQEYDITAVATDTFDIDVPSGTSATGANVANIKVRRVKPPLYWDGNPSNDFVRTTGGIPDAGISYRRLRSTGWASYINNRLIVPDGRSNIMLSDVFDADTFDPYWQSFRVGAGGNDRVIAVHPWVDGTFLVFCRKSIWLATVSQLPSVEGDSFDINTAVSKLELLTDEIGCSARKSIQTAGQFIYFLSDAGVYRLDTQLDLKLRGNTRPLSDPISDQFQSLNADHVENAVGLYHDNRYYIAAPRDGSSVNDGVWIYNQLNEQWETRDIYGVGVNEFIVVDVANARRILISNQAGKLMMIDEVEAGDESPSSEVNTTTAVPGKIVTRRFNMGIMSAKRFNRVLADVVLPDTSAITVTANILNPDKDEELIPGLSNTTGSSEDYSLKLPIRLRAHATDITVETTSGRPEIRAMSVEAAGSSLPPTETRVAA